MLKITVTAKEGFNNKTNEFVTLDHDVTICLEHSLVSISKWESKWHKPFLSKDQKTNEEVIDYVRCMTITQNVPPNTYYLLSQQNLKEINSYIENPMTATTFTNNATGKPASSNKEIITSEVLYYWMSKYNLPYKFETWHLNRLITLIRVCSVKEGSSTNKMSKRETAMSNKAINDARRKQYNTKG